MDCFSCFKSPNASKEKRLKCRKACCCHGGKPLKVDGGLPQKKEGKGCFMCKRSPPKDDNLSRKREDCGMCCFHRGKPKKDTSSSACANPSKGEECCSCFRSSKKGDKATAKKESKSKPGGKGMLCWKRKEKKKKDPLASLVKAMSFQSDSGKHRSAAEAILRIGNGNIAARVFTYRELSVATQNFASESLLGKGGFGKVYKGHLETNEDIAVKKLDRNGCQGNREFLIEVLMLSLLSHKNLVTLLGYCADGDQRILVYEYMLNGSVQDHLFDLPPGRKPLDWNTRMRIALGAAKGIEHLHDAANPPVIYRDLKASNILVDKDFNPKLADFGLAKLGPTGPNNHVSTRVMGTFGYCAPEYALTGKLTMMSDIYSFGVVLLELITGRKAADRRRLRNEQILVEWATPLFKDKRNFVGMADPLLEGKFPVKALYQAVAVAAMCLQEEDTTRPLIKDVVSALQYLSTEHSGSSIREAETSSGSRAPGEEEPRHSSDSDWQSCSTPRENEEELELDADLRRLHNADPQET